MAQPYLGYISFFAFEFAPKGWQQCNGQLIPIQGNTALFALLGTTYGGDAKVNFGLPDLRGRSAIGYGQTATNGNYLWGQKGGAENVTLAANNLPAHLHGLVLELPVNNGIANEAIPLDTYLSTPANYGNMYGPSANATGTYGGLNIQLQTTGSNAPIPVLNPYIVLNACIAITGLFPPRN